MCPTNDLQNISCGAFECCYSMTSVKCDLMVSIFLVKCRPFSESEFLPLKAASKCYLLMCRLLFQTVQIKCLVYKIYIKKLKASRNFQGHRFKLLLCCHSRPIGENNCLQTRKNPQKHAAGIMKNTSETVSAVVFALFPACLFLRGVFGRQNLSSCLRGVYEDAQAIATTGAQG